MGRHPVVYSFQGYSRSVMTYVAFLHGVDYAEVDSDEPLYFSVKAMMFRPTLANGFGRPINLNRAKL